MPVQFADFTLDESSRQLLEGGESVHLSPKAFQLLSLLIQETPRAISKAELQKQLWPDTFVTEGNLAGVVAELRSGLGDDAKEPRFIRTIYGFGYAFQMPVDDAVADPIAATDVLPVPPNSAGPLLRWGTASIAALLGAVGIVLIMSLRSMTGSAVMPPSVAVRSLAVLPFDTSGADPADQHLGLGLSDLLITRLSNVHYLVVRPTSAIREFAGRRVDSRQAGRDLKVDAVLEGSVRTSPDRIRVTVQLLNVRDQKPIWAERFDQKRTEMFTVEDDISARVAEALMVRLTPDEKSVLGKRYTTDPEAYQLYIQGRYQIQRGREQRQGGTRNALELFQKAVEKDPRYALAWAGVAHAYAGMNSMSGTGRPAPLLWEKAQAAAQTALQLDGDLSEGHSALGAVKMYWHLDYAGAEQELTRALELNPRNQMALVYYGYLLQCLGRFDEGIAIREREIEVDPLNPAVQWGLANAYLTARQYDRGIRQTLMVVGMDPTFPEPHNALARVYAMRGENEKAIAEGKRGVEVSQGDARLRAMAFLGYALGMAGRKAEAGQILEELKKEHVGPFHLAVVYMGLGQRDRVFPLLKEGVDDRSYSLRLKTEPILDPLRSDPRFTALLERAGFRS